MLILLQNHQLLIELEYQSQQVEELIKKKEINENKIFQLQRDIETDIDFEKNYACRIFISGQGHRDFV